MEGEGCVGCALILVIAAIIGYLLSKSENSIFLLASAILIFFVIAYIIGKANE